MGEPPLAVGYHKKDINKKRLRESREDGKEKKRKEEIINNKW